MTVRELITELQKHNPDAIACVFGPPLPVTHVVETELTWNGKDTLPVEAKRLIPSYVVLSHQEEN